MCWTQKFSFRADPVILNLKFQLAARDNGMGIFIQGNIIFFFQSQPIRNISLKNNIKFFVGLKIYKRIIKFSQDIKIN